MMIYVPDVKVGDKFGRLTYVSLAHRNDASRQWYWNMKCDCGKEVTTLGCHVRGGRVMSCGCLQKEKASAANKTHGRSRTPIHQIWKGIKQRCTNPKNPAYPEYGGRGILMCQEWQDSFESFLAHVGERPSPDHSIDRIDNNKGYDYGNVRWAIHFDQHRNRRNTVKVGDETLKELCKKHDLDYFKAYNLIVRKKVDACTALKLLESSKKAPP